MGLDWIVGNKAKPGHEEEFVALLAKGNEGGITEEMQARYDEISVAAYSVVGAPVVGQDSVADAWILMNERLPEDAEEYPDVDLESAEASTPTSDEERAVLEEMAGFHVLALAPPCDGLPLYSHGGMMDELDETSFRGKFLDDCEDIIGSERMERAYEELSAEELNRFGESLLNCARKHAADNDCSGIEEEREPPEDFGTPASQAHILFAAGRWCCYWGSRGFPLSPWF